MLHWHFFMMQLQCERWKCLLSGSVTSRPHVANVVFQNQGKKIPVYLSLFNFLAVSWHSNIWVNRTSSDVLCGTFVCMVTYIFSCVVTTRRGLEGSSWLMASPVRYWSTHPAPSGWSWVGGRAVLARVKCVFTVSWSDRVWGVWGNISMGMLCSTAN